MNTDDINKVDLDNMNVEDELHKEKVLNGADELKQRIN